MGHIQKRVRKGNTRYVARYIGPDGLEHSKWFARKGRIGEPGTAAQWLSEQEAAIREHTWIDPASQEITLGTWARRWLKHRTGISSSTLTLYNSIVHMDIEKSGLGEIPLRRITSARLSQWLTELVTTRPWADKPLATSTASTRRNVIATILTAAIAEGLLTRNPMNPVKPPKRPVETAAVDPADLPTGADIWRLYDQAPPIFRELIIVDAGTGMRRGELLGLRLRNVIGDEIHVTEQLLMSENTRKFGPPKTRRALRRIPIGPQVRDAIDRHLERYPCAADEVIFRDRQNKPWRRSTFGWNWNEVRTRAGVPELRFHYLRHYYASVLIAGGENVRVVMERMGHASAEETLGTYARLWPDSMETTRKIADAALTRGTDGARGTG
ncbi:tyrosine-type recombinase/integrase [Rhodococcus koreensis]